jgi:hypothetical protein
MRRHLAAALALLALPLLPAASLPQSAAAAESAETGETVQVLVMLRLPATHVRGGATYSGSYGDSASQTARRRMANAIARARGMRIADNWPMPSLGVDCFVFDLPEGMTVDAAIQLLSREKGVAWVQPMQLYRGQGGRKDQDPLYPAQPAASAWRLSDLHRFATGRGVRVAVIDSKIDIGHPDLSGQFSADQDFVGNRTPRAEFHGTGVAGIIAAKANNGIGIAGVAPDARLMALRACWESGKGGAPTLCSTLTLARALQYAIDHGAQIINLSLSGPPDTLLDKLIDIALSRGITVIAAYDSAARQGGFPASKSGVVAVADESLRSWPPTVYGAPGQDIPTTQPGGRWYVVNGSSYAVAHIAGLLALVREERGSARVPIAVRPNRIVDACATLMAVTPSCDCGCALQTEKPRARR